ncbi:hypothetical protein [Sphingobacterium thalpophilum]|uniref:hypothetical protein n=1 Tax=Sphingobacterium thalpophilum TaxID=259 RepID=UPI0024A6BD6C|nr:hypothetical protein [Sphingobacterium thalpophilum]
MKQTQTNGKGQGDGHCPAECSSCSIVGKQRWSHAAMLREAARYLAEARMSLSAGCCCTGLTVRRYRRKFAVFPRRR